LDPARFGLARQIVLGKHSGIAAVRHALCECGLSVGDDDARRILDRVRAHAEAEKRPVAIDELLSFHAATMPV
jgi:homocitrate synthase NifV